VSSLDFSLRSAGLTSPSLESYTGLSAADSFNYERWAAVFHPDDLVYVLPLWTESMRTGEVFRVSPLSPRPPFSD
jgi:hypothetical protein